MEFLLVRDDFSDIDTLGTVIAQSGAPNFRLQTLELPWMGGANIHDKTCILPGRYEISIYRSPKLIAIQQAHPERHLNTEVLLLHDVPGRQFVEVHIGNTAADLLGCICCGLYRGMHSVLSSAVALVQWQVLVSTAAIHAEKSYLTIQNCEGTDPDEGSSLRA